MGYGEEIGPKTIGVHQLPVRMPIRGLGQPLARQGMERPLHRVERLGRAGEQAELAQVLELRRHFHAVLRVEDVPIRQPQLDDRHPVFGEGAGLVGAQHGGRAQRLDRRRAPRQHARQRNSPRAHRHEDGQDDRKLFRQHRHAQRNSGQHRVQPSAAHDAVEQHREHADPAAENGKQPDDAPCLHLQARRFGFEGGQRLADLADLALRTDGGYFRQSRAAHHQRTGEDLRQVVASRTLRSRPGAIVPGDLAHRHGFAGQGRFVGLQILATQKNGIGRHPVAFGKNDEVAPHDVAAGDPPALAVANDERAGAREVAQRFQHALGPRLLHHGDHDRHGREGDQDDRLLQVAERQVNDAADQKQRQHRLAQHLDRYSKRRAPIRLRKLVVPLGLQPRRCIGFGEAGKRLHRSKIRYRRHPIGVHLAAFVERDIFADDEAFVREVIADVVRQTGLAVVIVESPAAAWPVNQMTMLVLLVRALAHDPAGVAMLAPQSCIDAVLGIERRHDDIGHLGIAFGMAGLAGQREAELPELRRQGSVQDRLRLGRGSGLGHLVWLLGFSGMRLLPPP